MDTPDKGATGTGDGAERGAGRRGRGGRQGSPSTVRRAAPEGDGSEAESRTLAERLAAAMADSIVSGEFTPGTRLDEHSLARRYAVSRTPVREALRQVAASGLIETRPRRGAVVASVTPAGLEALFGAMAEMEATCARLCAIGMTPLERRRFQALHESMAALVELGEPDAYDAANREFHLALYAGCHNPVLQDIATGLRRRLAPFRRAQFRNPGRLPLSWREHDAVVQAVLSGNAAAAHATMLHHVSLVEDAFGAFAAGVERRPAHRPADAPAG
ncbi:GntR family transcriptional regulator [Roseomonas sp. NAR14]|uniref:GntR family transcriptional regulator n=1 Tax=Roseomonas acroporae TaxID=2937791 RepID=A0A9X1Y6Y3_9PROT|nr:GntR family transcriptional regulator [Roseomonas acroporae]MCK8783212.1 GntR family transcriptional regulator [Roseomonas acroporae]